MKSFFKIITLPVLFLGIVLTGASPTTALAAQTVEDVFGVVVPPTQIQAWGPGSQGISFVLNKIIELIYIAASIAFVIMVIVSAFQWIVSGGDKEAVAGARKRLTWAVIGIVVLALAFVIIQIIGQMTGFKFFAGQNP